MKKTTSQKLSNRLVQYGALSAAIAGVTNTNGQIIWTDIPDISRTNTSYQLNLDGDAAVDFTIVNYQGFAQGIAPAASYIFYVSSYLPYGFQGFNSNAILGIGPIGSGSWKYPFALSSGDPISAGATTWLTGSSGQTMNVNNCSWTYSQWCNVNNKYLGLKFKIGAYTHYGWAKLDAGSASFTIKEYAYNSTPDAPINAGQKPLGIEDNRLSKVKIVGLNKSIGLYNLPEASNYTVYNLTGQEIAKGTANSGYYAIDVKTLASGIYIVELGDTESNAVLRKKVVLQ